MILPGGMILRLKPLGYEIINLGGHEVITINNLIKLIEDVVGKKAVVEWPPNPADMRSNWADVSKAGALLGWEPQLTCGPALKNWWNGTTLSANGPVRS